MATSGSSNFSVTGQEIVEGALRSLGVLGRGRALQAGDLEDGLEALNMLVKQWQGKADFAPGLKVWTRKRATLFLQNGTYEYDLGPSGDHATSDTYAETTMRVAASTSATTLEVASTTGMTAGDYIGIVLDSGSIHWDTVASVTDGDTVVITTGLASAAAIGRKVYAYTNKIQRPLQILTFNLREADGSDTPIYPMLLEEYEAVPDKDAPGTPTRYLYESHLTNGVLRFDTAPDDVSDLGKFVYLRPVEDLDAGSNDMDYPQHWFRALKFNLALDLAPEKGKEPSQQLRDNARISLMMAQNVDPDTSDLFFMPET